MLFAWGLPCVDLKLSSNPTPVILFNLIFGDTDYEGSPCAQAMLCRPLADNFFFLEISEDPEGTEISSALCTFYTITTKELINVNFLIRFRRLPFCPLYWVVYNTMDPRFDCKYGTRLTLPTFA